VPARDPDFAFLAHDLNQLLWAIQGRAEVLAQRVPAAAAAARAIAADAGAAAAMLRGAEAAWCEPQPAIAAAWRQAADHARAAGHAAADHRTGPPAADVHLETTIDAPPLAIPATALRRILANLFVNAWQALPDGGHVTCRVTVDAGRARLRVCDDGPGIAPGVASCLFAPGATAGKAHGQGLGLAGSRALARRHGGELRLVPAPVGTCFELEVPVAAARAAAASEADDMAGADAAAWAPLAQGLRVLVVDDEAPVREMLADLLASAGHRADLCPTPEAALARLRAARYDAALIDLGLPGPGGDVLAAAVRADDPALAVIVVTGWGREGDLADLDPACVDFTATKPLDLGRLADLLARAARRTADRRAGDATEA